jgi:hypothetical protein
MENKANRGYISPIIRAQIGQLNMAKRHARYERAQFGVTTYGHLITPEKQREISHKRHVHPTAPIEPTANNEAAVKALFERRLKGWNMDITAPLLVGVFFAKYRQAYNAMRRLELAELYTNKDGLFSKKL